MSHRANVNNTMKNTQNQELPPVAVGSIDLLDDLPGALLLAKGVAEQKWPHTVDARAWADEWLRTLKEHPDIATDRDTMIGWFANSIMAGYDTAASRSSNAELSGARPPLTNHNENVRTGERSLE